MIRTKTVRLLGLALGTVMATVWANTSMGRANVAQGCANFWINPRTGVQECLDRLSNPASPSPRTPSSGSHSTRAPETNWMRDRVRERLIAQALAASPGLTPAELGSAITPRIVGGSRAGAADNPFQVALLNRSVADNFNAQFCGGTLYKGKYVITAAHCVDGGQTASQLQVLTYSRSIPAVRNLNPVAPHAAGVRRNVARIAIHPGWNPSTADYDIAVLTLSASVPGGVSVGSLATSNPAVGTGMLATGWGRLSESGGWPNDLLKVALPLVSHANCNDRNSYNGQITSRMICAGRDAGGIDTCSGDSGGPLARGNILYGVVSWGGGCAKPNLHGVYTNISHNTTTSGRPGIRSWIVSRTP